MGCISAQIAAKAKGFYELAGLRTHQNNRSSFEKSSAGGLDTAIGNRFSQQQMFTTRGTMLDQLAKVFHLICNAQPRLNAEQCFHITLAPEDWMPFDIMQHIDEGNVPDLE